MRIACAFALLTGPATEPVTLEEAKAQLRIDGDDEDAAITRRIAAVRAEAEAYLGFGLFTQTWKLTLDDWADEIELPMAAPLQSVTGVTYYDGAGDQQALAASVYQVDTVSAPGRIYRAPDQVWPGLQIGRRMPIEITYVVGYSDVANIPPDILEALMLGLGTAQEFRESIVAGDSLAELPNGALAKLGRHRVTWTQPVAA